VLDGDVYIATNLRELIVRVRNPLCSGRRVVQEGCVENLAMPSDALPEEPLAKYGRVWWSVVVD
jgi:hypothetical protein